MSSSGEPILEVRDLTVEFATEHGVLREVYGVSFVVRPGEIVGLVGESGAGKSLTSEAILGLIPCPPGRTASCYRSMGEWASLPFRFRNHLTGTPNGIDARRSVPTLSGFGDRHAAAASGYNDVPPERVTAPDSDRRNDADAEST